MEMRTIFGKKNENSQGKHIDRFIHSREYFNGIVRRRSCQAVNDTNLKDINISIEKLIKQKNYTTLINKLFGLETNQEKAKSLKQWNHAWPCKPRKKCYLSSADSILDLPTYSFAVFPELLDWSKDNIMVAALGVVYHKWSWSSQAIISRGFTSKKIYCCKFDPRGELLLLGTEMRTVEIHNNAQNKREAIVICPGGEGSNMTVNKPHLCTINTVDWSPTGNSFIIGCSYGYIVSYTRSGTIISSHDLSLAPIRLVRVSPDARFVAVTPMDGKTLILVLWPSLTLYSLVKTSWIIQTTWHPWRSALLGVCDLSESGFQTNIGVWNAPTGKFQELITIPEQYALDTMLFSNNTGELVLSLCNTERYVVNRKACSQLVVLSSPDTVVDQWGEDRGGLNRVRTMVFNPDGTKLATATSDEDLIIWNFLPEKKNSKKKIDKRFSALPVYLDESTQGNSFR